MWIEVEDKNEKLMTDESSLGDEGEDAEEVSHCSY